MVQIEKFFRKTLHGENGICVLDGRKERKNISLPFSPHIISIFLIFGFNL